MVDRQIPSLPNLPPAPRDTESLLPWAQALNRAISELYRQLAEPIGGLLPSAPFVSLQATTPGTAQPGNFNIDGVGIAARLKSPAASPGFDLQGGFGSITKDANAAFDVVVYNSTPGIAPAYEFLRGRGTLASPSAVQSGDGLGDATWYGLKNATPGGWLPSAQIRGVAAENFDATHAGGELRFLTTQLGGTAPAERARLTAGGDFVLKLQDKGGQVFNVKAYGAKGDDATDDTAAIDATKAAAAAVAPRGIVHFPPGIYLTTGLHSLSGLNGISVVGSGVGRTIIKLTHATNDLFTYSGDLLELTMSGFSVVASASRTAGWVLKGPSSGFLLRSRISDIDIKQQTNGIWIPQFEFVWLDRVFMSDFKGAGNGVGLKIGQTAAGGANQGSEFYLTNCQVYGSQFLTPGSPSLLQYGIWIEDCQAVYGVQSGAGGALVNNWRFVTNAAGPNILNCFFADCVSDATDTGHSTYITGTGLFQNSRFVNGHMAGAGQLTASPPTNTNGLRIDCAVLSGVSFVGMIFAGNRGTGAYFAPGAAGAVVLNGNIFGGNGAGNAANNNDDIYLGFAAGQLGAQVVGNLSGGVAGTGVSIRIPASASTQNVIVGNTLTSGVSYGTMPEISALNRGGGDAVIPGTSRFTGRIAAARSALALGNGDNNNIALPATSYAKITGPTAAFALTGIVAGGDGDEMRLYNSVFQTMTVKNLNAGSAVGNRIITLTGADVVLRATANSFVSLIYDTSVGAWILMSFN